EGRLRVDERGVLAFKEAEFHLRPPVLAYAMEDSQLARHYAIRVNYFDTSRCFGPAGLERLAQTFVGAGKLEGFDEATLADMLATFPRGPERAYAYAIQDAVLTLLVGEGMAATHRKMYRDLGFQEAQVPELRSTLGSRVADLIVRSVARAAEGSAALSGEG